MIDQCKCTNASGCSLFFSELKKKVAVFGVSKPKPSQSIFFPYILPMMNNSERILKLTDRLTNNKKEE